MNNATFLKRVFVKGLSKRLAALMLLASSFTLALYDRIWSQVTVGAMGDSITDEWSNLDTAGNTFGYSTVGVRNWVEFAAASGKLNFGPYTAFTGAGISGSNEVRRAGEDRGSYLYNFARGGASTEANGLGAINTFLSRSYTQNSVFLPSPKSFRQLADDGSAAYGSLIIGGNDFLYGINLQTYWKDTPSSNTANQQRLQNMRQALLDTLNQATDSGNAPIKMVLGDLFDVGQALATAGAAFTAQQRANIRSNIQAWNAIVRDVAANAFPGRPMPVVSLWDWWEEAAAGQAIIHGINVRAQVAPTAAINASTKRVNFTQWNNLVLPDGVHPAPIGAALLAQRFIAAIREGYGETAVAPYTAKELVTLTALDPQRNPIADAGGPYRISLADSLKLNAGASTDPNPGDLPYLSYMWDLNNDGDFGDAQGVSPLLSPEVLKTLGIDSAETFSVSLRVDDSFGGSDTATASITVVPEPYSHCMLLTMSFGCIVIALTHRH